MKIVWIKILNNYLNMFTSPRAFDITHPNLFFLFLVHNEVQCADNCPLFQNIYFSLILHAK